MSTSQCFDVFFDLPGEIREQILGYLLIKRSGINISSDYDDVDLNLLPKNYLLPTMRPRSAPSGSFVLPEDDGDEDYGPEWPLNYFLVSQTFNREATAVYFRENTFHILTKGTKVLFNAHKMGDARFRRLNLKAPRSGDMLLADPAWARSRRRIRKAVVYIQRPRGFVEAATFTPLLDMILAGGLKELEFRVGFKAPSQRIFGDGVMRAMYRVLTDPDLVDARLSIPSQLERHGSGWCGFHEDGGHAASGTWIKVDLAALIRQYGEVEDQFRILKVGE